MYRTLNSTNCIVFNVDFLLVEKRSVGIDHHTSLCHFMLHLAKVAVILPMANASTITECCFKQLIPKKKAKVVDESEKKAKHKGFVVMCICYKSFHHSIQGKFGSKKLVSWGVIEWAIRDSLFLLPALESRDELPEVVPAQLELRKKGRKTW